MKFKSEAVHFETILPIWRHSLWPDRKSQIKHMSSMTYEGKIDMSIYKKYTPTFFAVYNNAGQIIGVNSGHQTGDRMYRSRGIWVDPVYRGKGVAGILFCELEGQAMKEQCKSIWSVPREKALPSYVKYGFKQTSDFFNEGMEFGPNCYVIKELDYELKQH